MTPVQKKDSLDERLGILLRKHDSSVDTQRMEEMRKNLLKQVPRQSFWSKRRLLFAFADAFVLVLIAFGAWLYVQSGPDSLQKASVPDALQAERVLDVASDEERLEQMVALLETMTTTEETGDTALDNGWRFDSTGLDDSELDSWLGLNSGWM